MKILPSLFSSEFIEAIGWTIVHSIWQGVAVALLLTILLILMRKNSAQVKYLISFFALIIVLGWSAVTFSNVYSYAKEKTELRKNMTSNAGYIKAYLEQNISKQEIENAQNTASFNLQMIKLKSFLQRNFYWVCSVWFLGMVFLMVRLIGGFLYAHRLRNYQLVNIGEEWLHKLEELSNRLNLKRKVRAYFSPLAKSPLTLGTIKPVILFPIAAFSGLSVKDVEAIIAHELAHVHRHDYFFNIIHSLVEILFFYHPAIWMISAHIRNERENSCDNLAVNLTGDKVAYVKALAKVEIYQVEQEQLAMAFAGRKRSIIYRIKRLQKHVAMKTNFIEGIIAAGVVVIGLTLVSFTMGNEKEKIVETVQQQQTNPKVQTIQSNSSATSAWTNEQRDSLRQSLEKNIQQSEKLDKVSEEMKKMVEVALSEQDEEISAEMMAEINAALKEINVGEIIHAAMHEAQKAIEEINMKEIMREAKSDIDYKEIQRDMEEAKKEIKEAKKEMRKEMRRDMEETGEVSEEMIELSIKAAEAGLDVAEAVLENLPINEIIDAALSGVEVAFDAIGDIDFDAIFDDISDEITKEDIARIKKELQKKEKQLEVEKEKLKQKEKELNKQK